MLIKKFISNNIYVIFFLNIGNLSQLLFSLLIGKYLPVDQFVVFMSINSILYIFNSFFAVSSHSIPKIFSEFKERNYFDLIHFLLLSCAILCIINTVIFYIIYTYFLKETLNIVSETKIYIYLLFYNFLIPFTTIFFSILQSLKKFFWYGFSNFIILFLKLIFLLTFYLFQKNLNLDYVYKSILFGTFFTVFFLSIFFWFQFISKSNFESITNFYKKNVQIRKNIKFHIRYFILFFLFNFATNFDVVLAKKYLIDPFLSEYIVSSFYAKIIFFLTLGIQNVLFPEIIKNFKKSGYLTNVSIIINTFLQLVASIFMFFALDYVHHFIFEETQLNKALLLILIISQMVISNSLLFMNKLLSYKILDNFLILVLLIQSILFIIIYFSLNEILNLAQIFMISNIILLFAMVLILKIHSKKKLI